MTIDEAIAQEREKAKEIRENIIDGDNLEPYESYCNTMVAKSAEKYEQIAQWLEELKEYRDKNKMVVRIACVNSEEFKDIAVKLAKEQYNKAIDDYKSGIKEELERFEVKNLDTCVLYNLMDRIAEQLKAGGENVQKK